jgi:hypothetical protein
LNRSGFDSGSGATSNRPQSSSLASRRTDTSDSDPGTGRAGNGQATGNTPGNGSGLTTGAGQNAGNGQNAGTGQNAGNSQENAGNLRAETGSNANNRSQPAQTPEKGTLLAQSTPNGQQGFARAAPGGKTCEDCEDACYGEWHQNCARADLCGPGFASCIRMCKRQACR